MHMEDKQYSEYHERCKRMTESANAKIIPTSEFPTLLLSPSMSLMFIIINVKYLEPVPTYSSYFTQSKIVGSGPFYILPELLQPPPLFSFLKTFISSCKINLIIHYFSYIK